MTLTKLWATAALFFFFLNDPAPPEIYTLSLHAALPILSRELLVCRIVFRAPHQPRGAAIEPMDDAGPLFAADPAQIVDVVEKRIHQRSASVASGRKIGRAHV